MVLVGALFVAFYGTCFHAVETLNVRRVPEVVLFPPGGNPRRALPPRLKNVPRIPGLPLADGQTRILLKSPPPLERVRFPFGRLPMMPFGSFPPFFPAGPDVGNVVIYRITPKTMGEKDFTTSSRPHMNGSLMDNKSDNEGNGQRDRYSETSDNKDGFSGTSERERNTNYKNRKPFSSSVNDRLENGNTHDSHGHKYKGHENQRDHFLNVGERVSETDRESNYPRGDNGNRRTNYHREWERMPRPDRDENLSGASNVNQRNNHNRGTERRPTPNRNDNLSKADNADRRSLHRERERPTDDRNDSSYGVNDSNRGIDYHREGEQRPILDGGENFYGVDSEVRRKNHHREGERRRILDRGESSFGADNGNRENNYHGEREIRPTSNHNDNFSGADDNSRRNNHHRKGERLPPPDRNDNISGMNNGNRRNNYDNVGERRPTPDRGDNFSGINNNNRRNYHHAERESKHPPQHGDNFSGAGSINLRNNYHKEVERRPTPYRDDDFAGANIDNRRDSYHREEERPAYNRKDSYSESVNGTNENNYNQEQKRPSTGNVEKYLKERNGDRNDMYKEDKIEVLAANVRDKYSADHPVARLSESPYNGNEDYDAENYYDGNKDLVHSIPGTNHNFDSETNQRNEQREEGAYRLGGQKTSNAPFQTMERNYDGEIYNEELNIRPNKKSDRNHYGDLNKENDRTWSRDSPEAMLNKGYNYNGNGQGENEGHQSVGSSKTHIHDAESSLGTMKNEDIIEIQSNGDIVMKESDKSLIMDTKKPMTNDNNRDHMEYGPEDDKIIIDHGRNIQNSMQPNHESPQNNPDTILNMEKVSRVGNDNRQNRKTPSLIDKRKDYKYIDRRRDLPTKLSGEFDEVPDKHDQSDRTVVHSESHPKAEI